MRILDDVGVALKNFGPAERILEVRLGEIPERIALLYDVNDLVRASLDGSQGRPRLLGRRLGSRGRVLRQNGR